ncbi:MAG: hypothetical protein Q4C96_04610 [Planctomycetia bacterium]|nr:hypothetical protein [Planctomycetia bacterium]
MKDQEKNTSERSEEMESQNSSCECTSADMKHYHMMSLTVSRNENGKNTCIGIHRQTGKPTTIDVSQGGRSWTLSPKELYKLPEDLSQEVRSLLHAGKSEKEGSSESFWECCMTKDADADFYEEELITDSSYGIR